MNFGPNNKRGAEKLPQQPNKGKAKMRDFYDVTWTETVELRHVVTVEASSEAEAIMIVEAKEGLEPQNKPLEPRKPQRKVIR